MPAEEMTPKEIDQFLTCARVGRLGISLENGPYIVPVGYAYANGKIFFHTCNIRSVNHKVFILNES